MRNIRLTLAYDGTNYVGWQIQPNGVSVQAMVEAAIQTLTGERVKLIAAGRTDAGVHALGQVANFQTESTIGCKNIVSGLQSYLPDDIVVRAADEVAEDFHATYSAVKKHYRYVIYNSRIRDPFLDRYAWQHSVPLDAEAMHAAVQTLLGKHDFRCFESQFPNKATSVRTIVRADVSRHANWSAWQVSEGETSATQDAERPFIFFDVAADGFLYNMVRAIVGTLVNVGLGKWTPADVRKVVENQDRTQAGATAPAHGLYLVAVEYRQSA